MGKSRERGHDRACISTAAAIATLVAAAALDAFALPSLAADGQSTATAIADSQQLEEVVVTARKRTENLQDVPATVQAISATAIAESHLTQLDDIGGLVSNLNIFEAHDNSPAVVMRGVGSFEQVVGVGFYMNDVQLFEGQTARPMDIERIEVLKGPQGTLYGGANIGGAIKYVTKDPTSTWQNEASLEGGNLGTFNASAVFSGPISSDLGLRLSAYSDNHGGYIWDTYQQRTLGASHDRGARLVLLANPGSNTRVHFSVNYEDYTSENENLQYKVTEFDAPLTPYTADNYRYTVADFFSPSFARKTESAVFQIDQQLTSDVALTSITSQFWSKNRGITDFTKKPIPLDLLFQNDDQRVASEELRLASTGHSNLDWLVGIFGQWHKSYINNSDLNYNGDIPATPTTWATDQQLPSDSDLQTKVQKQLAMFADATYHYGNWEYELGLRAEHYSSNLSALNQPSTGPGPLPPGPVSLGPQTLNGNMVSPRVSVQYRFSPTLNLYTTFARGFQPADLEEQNLTIASVRAETASSYELGMKWRLPHGAQFNLAAFYLDYHDRLYQTMVAAPGGFQDITTNIGPSRNSGFELEWMTPLSSEWTLSGGLGTTRAIWGNAQYGDPQLTAANQGVVVYRNLNGLTAPFTPEYSANLALAWSHALSNGYKLGAEADGSAIGQSYWDPNDIARQKPYQLFNAGAHLYAGPWSWIARVTNLSGTRFNTMYWDATDVGVPDNHSFARINRPRMYSLSVTRKW